ncbi:MAG: glycosyltransferase [Deltaproteobacteria bacterium]|nr:MAG: glycosyltransferase [Deltaproteobacteria bacterium]
MPRSTRSSRSSSRSVPRAADARLIVMAKHPMPGRVKTRLAAAIGAAAAAALSRAFIRDLATRLAALPYAVTWAYSPRGAPFRAVLGTLPAGWRCRLQRGQDLGERMANAIRDELRRGAGPVLVIGADVPHVPAAALAEAAAALTSGCDLVLGPAADGGYYLIGVKARRPALFAGMPWGTDTVFTATRQRARRLGIRTHVLAPIFDVDELEDLDRLRALVARGELDLRCTARLLTRVVRPPAP